MKEEEQHHDKDEVKPIPPSLPPSSSTSQDELLSLSALEKDLEEAEQHVKQFDIHISNASKEQQHVKKASLRFIKDLASFKKRLTPEEYDALKLRVNELRVVLPETKSVFARLMLGRVNLKVWNESERQRLRDEHYKFKFRTNIIFIALPCLVLFAHYRLRFVWADTHWMNILHQSWLVYFYASLALRENILWVNGSNMKAWWIYHHYFAAFGSIMLITWPPTETYVRVAPYWQVFLLYLGCVQVLQLWYQQKRDYANRALGKTKMMDVTFSETLTEFPKELMLLVPFVLVAHLWQISFGMVLLHILVTEMKPWNTHWTNYVEEVQCFVCGVVALLLGVGNLLHTTGTLWRRSRTGSSAKKKKD